jgi:hypothetical protein
MYIFVVALTWTMMKKEEQAVHIFGRNLLRIMYGSKYGDREWKIGRNEI